MGKMNYFFLFNQYMEYLLKIGGLATILHSKSYLNSRLFLYLQNLRESGNVYKNNSTRYRWGVRLWGK